jgi:hypothetical protein
LKIFSKAESNNDLSANIYEGEIDESFYPFEEYKYYLFGGIMGLTSFIVFFITRKFIK